MSWIDENKREVVVTSCDSLIASGNRLDFDEAFRLSTGVRIAVTERYWQVIDWRVYPPRGVGEGGQVYLETLHIGTSTVRFLSLFGMSPTLQGKDAVTWVESSNVIFLRDQISDRPPEPTCTCFIVPITTGEQHGSELSMLPYLDSFNRAFKGTIPPHSHGHRICCCAAQYPASITGH